MNTETIVRAWKDPAFRASLTSEQLAALPECPSGKPMTELGEGDLADVVGGSHIIRPTIVFTRPPTIVTITVTKGSAIDACPSALACPFTTFRQTPIFQDITVVGG
jgi:mersacidin/lichenicidin family type 2 lantibiotic